MREPWILVPIVVVLTSLAAVDDLAQIPIPAFDPDTPAIVIDRADWSVAARTLSAGTATLVVKNLAGATLASSVITSAGRATFRPIVATIAPGDCLRFGFSGVGVGLADVTVTGWLRLPSTV